jgi:hypothetical protein
MKSGKALLFGTAVVLCLGLLAGAAFGAKKKSTQVVFFNGSPNINLKNAKVMAKGAVNSVSACQGGRAVRLQLQDSTGTVISTLDGSTSSGGGNFSLNGKLPTLANGNYAIRVKAKKASVGKFVCQAGVTAPVPFTVPAPTP